MISYRYHGIITNYILTPKYPDNSGVDAGHEEKREKVEEEDLDTSVSKVCRVAPSWDTRGKIPEDVFNNTGKVVPIVEKGDSRQDDSFWQAEEDGGGPDEDEDEDNSSLGVHKGGEGLADSWNKDFCSFHIQKFSTQYFSLNRIRIGLSDLQFISRKNSEKYIPNSLFLLLPQWKNLFK